ncbi:SURF1 family protein [Microbacterium awajiense]|uniref:SURF1-like protein n=1 Tax=Microbacterium awajiense TaxID=415214 RepID=A0ABP7A3D4_9MICO
MSGRRVSAGVRWAAYVAIAVTFAVACAFLSNWQFARNAERSAQLELVEANYDRDPVPLDELIPLGESFDDADEWRPVTLTGRYLADATLLARNRAHGGTAAYEVLVPFALDDGRVIVVDRGWVPPGSEQSEPDHVPAPPEGAATVVVRLRTGEPLPPSGRSAPEGQVPTIHLPLIAETLDSSGLVDAYGALVSEDPATERPAAVEDPSEDPGPHLSYAIQWILFAIMGFVFIGYVIRTEVRHRHEADDEEDTAARPPQRGRRDPDADIEDALADDALSADQAKATSSA